MLAQRTGRGSAPRSVGAVDDRWWTDRARHGGLDRVVVEGAPGSLWLCGKHLIGPDHRAVVERTGAAMVVCLTHGHELEGRYDDYLAWLRSGDPVARWVPVHDLSAPPVDVAVALVDDIGSRLDAGESVVVHCAAGIGRAGTTAAALLVRRGATPEQAVAHVAASRPMAGPEAGAQTDLLHAIAALGR